MEILWLAGEFTDKATYCRHVTAIACARHLAAAPDRLPQSNFLN